jgi:hypothetical protein
VVNLVIEDATSGARAIYGWKTGAAAAVLAVGNPTAVMGGMVAFATTTPRTVDQFEGRAAIRVTGATGGVTAGLGGWKIELQTPQGVIVIPLSPGRIDLGTIPSQGSLERFQSRPVPTRP